MTTVLSVFIVLLVAALIAVILIWYRAYKLLARYDAIDDVDTFREQCEKESKRLQTESKQLEDQIGQQKQQLKKYMEVTGVIKSAAEAKQRLTEFNSQLEATRRDLAAVEETSDLQQVGFYKRRYDFDTPDAYKRSLEEIVSSQKIMIKGKVACVCGTEWHVEGSAAKGRKMVNEQIRLMLRAFNGECDAAVSKLRYNNIDKIERRIQKCFDAMNKMGATKQITLSSEFLDLKLKELYLTHEHEIAKQEEKERQREIKQQIREEQRAEREIADAQRQAEKQEAEGIRARTQTIGCRTRQA